MKEIELSSMQSNKWAQWSEHLWREAASGWLTREGQDHYYRETVVLPALLRAVDKTKNKPQHFIDLGCGDGHSTSLLVSELERHGHISPITLVDRSAELLEAAVACHELKLSKFFTTDFTSLSWSCLIPKSHQTTIFFATFLLQELFDLRNFFGGLREIMSESDQLFAVVPAPRYAESLRRSSRLNRVSLGAHTDDWRWVGEYPISTLDAPLKLPHFQRTMADYRRIARSECLNLISHEDLGVSKSQAAYEIYSDTIYGLEIIGRPSAKLLTFAPLTFTKIKAD